MKNRYIIIIISAILVMTAASGCRERIASLPGPEPTATVPEATPVATLVDDFTDAIGSNELGGTWFAYSDASDQWGYVSASPGYDDTGYALSITISTQCTGYGVWLVTTFAAGGAETDVSTLTGVRFYAKEASGKAYKIVLLSGATGNNYQYTFTNGTDWGEVNIPFTSFTQSTSDGTTISQALARAISLAWSNTACPMTAEFWLDHIEIY